MKKNIRNLLALGLTSLTLVACGDGTSTSTKPTGSTSTEPTVELSAVQKVIAEAQTMDAEDLYKKAMDEINGKEFVVIANSSRTPKAATQWLNYLKEKYKDDAKYKDFTFTCTSTQPKNNQIFSQIKSDVTGSTHNISLTLIQDGSQIASKMTKTGYLRNYIPKEWDGVKATDGEPLALQSLNKVFCYNTLADKDGNTKTYKNVWDFADGTVSTQFMSPASEPVGSNFLYMLTKPEYAKYVKEAYDALDATRKAAVDKVIADKNAGIADVYADIGATDANVKYSLAWIYSFIKSYTAVSDDGPISVNLTKKSAGTTAGLLVYSKFRSIEDTDESTAGCIQVAAHQSDYVGFGGYMYKHYLQVLDTAPYPWTACALINYMTTTVDGFSPWGKDAGGYSASPKVATGTEEKYHHKTGGKTVAEEIAATYDVKKDRGYDWWVGSKAGEGRLIVEDGEYASSVAGVMSDWISYLR